MEVSDKSRVKSEIYLSKIVKADDIVKLIKDGDTIGFSGFVGSGIPLVVPKALANRAEELHKNGEKFQISVFTGASTDVDLDGALAGTNAVKFRTPFSTDKTMRTRINSGETAYLDVHLSSLAPQVRAGFFWQNGLCCY